VFPGRGIRRNPVIMRNHWPIFIAALLALQPCDASPLGGAPETRDARFDFALIGDIPYNDFAATNEFPNLIEAINRAEVAFVVHDGDIKAGATPCSDDLFLRAYGQFQTFRHPLVYLFGDNEWTDCGAVKSDPRDPMERLTKLRAIFTAGNQTLGRSTLTLTRQSEQPAFAPFRENVRWVCGGVIFAGLNVPGDANNFGQPEYAGRNAANLAWVRDAFALAKRESGRAVMILMQANPRFDLPSAHKTRAGFNDLIRLLEEETLGFQKPVVLVHGDTHYFRMDKPLVGSKSKRRIENFTRVETFGDPDAHWVRGTVDPADPQVFTFRPMLVTKNLLQHDRPAAPERGH
jgi:hypothetical protein